MIRKRTLLSAWLERPALWLILAALALPLGCTGDSFDEGDGGLSSDEDGDSRSSRKKSGDSSRRRSADDDEGDDGDSSDLRREALSLQQECEDAGLDGDGFESASSRLTKARRYEKDGEDKKAERDYKRAIAQFKDLLRSVEETKELAAQLNRTKQEVDALKEKAEKAEASVNAKDTWDEALALYESALAAMKKKDASSLAQAQRRFGDAKQLFEDAVTIAEENASHRDRALKEKELMVAIRTQAQEKGADTKAIARWQQAASLELDAETALENGDPQRAIQYFRDAKMQYTSALQELVDEAEFAAMLEKQRQQAAELAAAAAQNNPGGGTGFVPPPPPPSGGTGGGAPGGGIIPPTPGGVPGGVPGGSVGFQPFAGSVDCVTSADADTFPQELDEEDEAFLQANIHQLAVAAVYDPSTGGILLDYSSGTKLKQDLDVLKTPKQHVGFVDPQMALGGTQDIPDDAQISLDGNTQGLVMLPVPFRYKVRITYEFNILTITGGYNFGFMVNFDPRKKSHYVTNFLDLGYSSGGQPKFRTMPGKPASRANFWHTKVRPVPWVIDFAMEGPKGAAKLGVTYDFASDEETPNEMKLKKPLQGGLVGIRWQGVKFRIRKLRICGILDKEAAVAMLREKLGVPKGSGADADAGAEENPTAPGEEEPSDEDEEKKGGGFDF